MKPILRWAGSKRQLLPVLRKLTECCKFNRIVEPFCGSATFTLDREPSDFLLSDQNEWLVRTYEAIRDDYGTVHRKLCALPASNRDTYYRIRAGGFEGLSQSEAAAHFLYLNQHCFNGIYRTNKTGQFNVPFSGVKNRKETTFESLKQLAYFLRVGKIRHGDFESIVKRNLRKTDLVFLDPPYFSSKRRIFGEYAATTFCNGDLERINLLLQHIDRKGAKFILSFQRTEAASFLQGNWDTVTKIVSRQISGKVSARRRVREIMITNIGSS